MLSLPVLTKVDSVSHFGNFLLNNPGLVIIKFGAEWCGPCKKIETQVHNWLDSMPETVQSFIIDIDECFEIYAYLKTKKMVNGVPAILCYDKGNTSYIPSDSVIGGDPVGVDAFFKRCLAKVQGNNMV